MRHFFIQLRSHSSRAEDGLVYFLIDFYNTKFCCCWKADVCLPAFLFFCFFLSSFLFLSLALDGDQDRLPQNMAPWHINHFKLKEFEKKGKSRKVTLTSPHKLSSLKQVIIFISL